MDERAFTKLTDFLGKVPAVTGPIATEGDRESGWWVQFHLDLADPLAWQVVQEFGSVLNYLSLTERLPTVFKPISPPPYLNGGPEECLSWLIECSDGEFRPGTCANFLEARLPQPVDDRSAWQVND